MDSSFTRLSGSPAVQPCIEGSSGHPEVGYSPWGHKHLHMTDHACTKFVVTLLPRSKYLLISWLQSPSAVILEPPKIKSDTVCTISPSISHEMMRPDAMIFVFWILWVSAETQLPLGSFPYPTIWVKLIIASSGFHSTFFMSLYFSQLNVIPCIPLALRNHGLLMLVTAVLTPPHPQWPAPALVPSRSSRNICW